MTEKYIFTKTLEEQIEVLEALTEHGYRWYSGTHLSRLPPMEFYPEDKLLFINEVDKLVTMGDEDYLKIDKSCVEIKLQNILLKCSVIAH